MFTNITKRDGRVEAFDKVKITKAIFKAAVACGGNDEHLASQLTDEVVALAEEKYKNKTPDVEGIQDLVEKVLIEKGHARTAKAFILYREKRRSAREINALVGATINMFGDYLGDKDWNIKENANMQKSVNGLNNYVRETFTKKYWLHEVYPDDVRLAHESGDAHIHDLGFFGPYCAGWDLRQLLSDGFGGVENKVESKPAKHLRSFLGQIVNSTFTTQGETAGAQAWSSFDTYCAPFVYYDNMTFEQVKPVSYTHLDVYKRQIQGVTEFLPVSSSGHLILFQELFGYEAPLFFDIMLHVGSPVSYTHLLALRQGAYTIY